MFGVINFTNRKEKLKSRWYINRSGAMEDEIDTGDKSTPSINQRRQLINAVDKSTPSINRRRPLINAVHQSTPSINQRRPLIDAVDKSTPLTTGMANPRHGGGVPLEQMDQSGYLVVVEAECLRR